MPAVDAVELKSRSAPVVVEVSFEVDDTRANDPPFAITEVVCGMSNPVPVVRAFAVITCTGPVAVPAFRFRSPALLDDVYAPAAVRFTTPPAAPESADAPEGPVISSALPEVRAVAPPAVIERALPVVRALEDMAPTVPVVAELAVRLKMPVPVYMPVLVIPKSAPVALVVERETTSLAVAGDNVVPVRDQ